MGLARIIGGGIAKYVQDIINTIIKPKSEDSKLNPLRKDRVNEPVFDRVIEKFGKQTPYDRKIIRQIIDAERTAVNDARRVQRQERDRERSGIPVPRDYYKPEIQTPKYQVDVIIRWKDGDGNTIRGRVQIDEMEVGDRGDVINRLNEPGVLDQLFNLNQISFKAKDKRNGQPPAVGQIDGVDIISRKRMPD